MQKHFTIASPSSNEHIQEINSLLTHQLRDPGLKWKYSEEYPLLLSSTSHQQSTCVFHDNQVAAHANLFSRKLVHASGQKSFNIGLIGNVATSTKYQRQGLQYKLMEHLEKTALLQNIDALILWSDLYEFYQKLGFASTGREIRYFFDRNLKSQTNSLDLHDPKFLSDSDLKQMIAIRPKMEWNLERSTDDFAKLLTIPSTNLYISKKNQKISSYYIVGKGSDMQGVIHEWGTNDRLRMMHDIRSILLHTHLDSVQLLAPINLPSNFKQVLDVWAAVREEHPLCWTKPIGSNGSAAIKAIASSFIWGLDSI
jgi:predicted N-acetyltransferase YhbS